MQDPRATVRPPTPESKIPIGASFTLRSLVVTTASAAVVSRWLRSETLIDLFAGWTNWELLRVSARNPFLATEGRHWVSQYGRLHNLFFANVVRVALVIARFNYLLFCTLKQSGARGLAANVASAKVVVV